MFIESPRFPEGIAYESVGGPGFRTSVVETLSGREFRNARWSQALHRYEIEHTHKTTAEIDALRAFFLSVAKGRTHLFRFQDTPNDDWEVSLAEGRLGTGAVGTGTATYQLYKRYTSGSSTYDRIIQKPVVSRVTVYRNAVPVVIGGGAGQIAINYTSGVITFVAPFPTGSDVLLWEGEFDVPCRFDVDEFLSRPTDPGLHRLDTLPLVERRLP